MKKITIITVLLLALNIPQHSYAADACKIYLCMAGKALGSDGGAACKEAETDFFAKLAFKASGGISWSKTANARKSLISKCNGSDPSIIEKIIQMFGKVMG